MVDISLSVEQNSYRAAVFEIAQFQFEDKSYSGEDAINKNLEKYDKAAKVAAENAWSITNKVNVIAADAHDPRTGTVGSGIYSPDKGVLVYTHNPDGRSKLLISNVPKSPSDDLRNIEPPNTKFFYLDDDEVTELGKKSLEILKKNVASMFSEINLRI
ncbi:pantetheinase [Trichonephila inaurata madagascariensis]|uniref:Pantetheinase n=1 Tax=Trichonephila inaurata madagascariensis TaxID=2747483 RepID=A0A8X6Y440_9ARAC|nr:pantetheinase [Trichonephila inaurata madagascariensis]